MTLSHKVMEEAMTEPSDLLLGRSTYEMFSGGFSNAAADNPIAKKLNDAKKFVVTSTLQELE
ncbi:MAG: dihydrofolate reductase [Pirellulaceae bacterium]|jgi:dihydrofolate reductase